MTGLPVFFIYRKELTIGSVGKKREVMKGIGDLFPFQHPSWLKEKLDDMVHNAFLVFLGLASMIVGVVLIVKPGDDTIENLIKVSRGYLGKSISRIILIIMGIGFITSGWATLMRGFSVLCNAIAKIV
ncbi:MAG TPA: hypothetical protein VN426_02600 [Syntrophomonadaceae bacterium]|nr:hypothetical protein [Syntrophomonadaceae bacterium]